MSWSGIISHETPIDVHVVEFCLQREDNENVVTDTIRITHNPDDYSQSSVTFLDYEGHIEPIITKVDSLTQIVLRSSGGMVRRWDIRLKSRYDLSKYSLIFEQ